MVVDDVVYEADQHCIDEEQRASLDRLAEQEGVSRAELIRQLLNRALASADDNLASDLKAMIHSVSFATSTCRGVALLAVRSTLPECGAAHHDPRRFRCADRAFAGFAAVRDWLVSARNAPDN